MAATYHHPRSAMETPLGDPRNRPGSENDPFPASRWGATGRAEPLSLAQRALWDEQQRDRSSAAYNLIFAARVRSEVSIDRLEHCLQTLIDRHPALRTTFHDEADGPVQRIHSRQDIRLTCVDSRHWDEDQLAQIVRLTARQPIDLADSVLRAALFSRSRGDHVLLLMVHQIAVDSWALGILLRELRDLYAGDRIPPAPVDTPLAYAQDLAARLQGPEGRDLEEFWTGYLTGAPADPSLPYDRDAGSTPHRAGASVPFDLGVERSGRIRRLARESETTPYVLLLSAYQLLLARYTGHEDIVVATPFSGRMRRRWQNVVGNFVNTVPIRARLEGEESFRTLLQRGHRSVSEAMRNRELPFARICELLRAERGGRLDSACRVGFAWEGLPRMDALAGFLKLDGIPAPLADFGGLTLEPYPLPQQEGQIELMLEIGGEIGSSLFGTLRYDSTLFEATTARGFVRHYVALLDALLERPDAPISGHSLLDAEEWDALQQEWNRVEVAEPFPGGLHRLIEEQAALHPLRTAVEAGGVRVTYAELDRWANRVARALRSGGVDPRTRVAVAMDHSIAGVAAAVAVLKAGASCVPFDAAMPLSTTEVAAARIGAVVVPTRAQLGGDLAGTLPNLFVLEEMAVVLARTSEEPLGVGALPDDAAVVSVGPDSASGIVTHLAASTLLPAFARRLGLSAGASVASLRRANPAATLLDLLLALSSGSAALLPCEETLENSATPTEALERGQPAVLIASAAIWSALLRGNWTPSGRLVAVVQAGSLSPAEIERLRARVQIVWSVLEAPGSGIIVAARKVDRGNRRGTLVEPLPCTRLTVLDQGLRPAPLGLPGELFLGGVAVTPPIQGPDDGGSDELVVDPCDVASRVQLARVGRRGRRREAGVELLG